MSVKERVLSNFTRQKSSGRVYSGNKPKIGIIGTGWIAEALTESYIRQPGAGIVAMADLILGNAEKFAGSYGIKGCRFYPDHKAVLKAEKLEQSVYALTTPSMLPVPSAQILYNQAIINTIGDSAKLGREVDVYNPEA